MSIETTPFNPMDFLKTDDEKKKDANEALGQYLPFCPGAQSVIGCINITDEITFE